MRFDNQLSKLISYGRTGSQRAGAMLVLALCGVLSGYGQSTTIGVSTIGIFRPNDPSGQGIWVVDSNGSHTYDQGDSSYYFGIGGDLPVMGDWDFSGHRRMGVFRNGAWYVDRDDTRSWTGSDLVFYFGLPGDLPLTIGLADNRLHLAVFRPSDNTVIVDTSTCNCFSNYTEVFQIQNVHAGDQPVIINLDGLGGRLSFYRPSNGNWYVGPLGSSGSLSFDLNQAPFYQNYGGAVGDEPVAGDWSGSGSGLSNIGVYRGQGLWYVDSNRDQVWEPTDLVFSFGISGDLPVMGPWGPPQVTYTSGGHIYNVSVQAISGSGFAFPGHWLYTPSALLPSPQTNYQYYILFATNTDSHNNNQAVYLTQSMNGYSNFSTPAQILTMSAVDNICDMIGPRAVFDGVLWHVYLQARVWINNRDCGPDNPANYLFEATGPSLFQLTWVKSAGTNNAAPLITGHCTSSPSDPPCACNRDPGGSGNYGPDPSGGYGYSSYGACYNAKHAGFGQEFQVFNIGPYTGATSNPFLVNYNDWDNAFVAGSNGSDVIGRRSVDGTNWGAAWYDTVAASIVGYYSGYVVLWPDVILARSLEEASRGDLSIAIGSDPSTPGGLARGVGVWSTLVPYPVGSAGSGAFIDAQFPSSGLGADYPKFARNVYGYLDPVSDTPKTWQSYIYYGIQNYGSYAGKPQAFGVSRVTIIEQ